MDVNGPTDTPIQGNSCTQIRPEWLRVGDAVRYSSISRSLLYELLAEGHIDSRVLRKRGCTRGIRLVSVDSIDRFIQALPRDEGKD